MLKGTFFRNSHSLMLSGILTAIIVFLFSCRHDMDAVPEVKYSADIQGILSGNCTYSGCHGDASVSGDRQSFSLVGYENVMRNGSVKAGNAHSSKLYKTISNHGGSSMPPPPHPALTTDQIKLIFIWIEQGAKNN